MALLVLLVLLVVASAGCGYTVSTRVETAATGKTISITPFANKTDPHVPAAEIVLHNSILELVAPGPYRIAPAAEADIVVTGEIAVFQQSILSLRTATDPSEIRVTLQAKVHVEQRWPKKATWEETIAPTVDSFALETGETFEETAQRAVRRLAREVVNTFVNPKERWGAQPEEIQPERGQ